jgi:hypothetical protein
VNCVAPWMTMTPMLAEAVKGDPSALDKVAPCMWLFSAFDNTTSCELSWVFWLILVVVPKVVGWLMLGFFLRLDQPAFETRDTHTHATPTITTTTTLTDHRPTNAGKSDDPFVCWPWRSPSPPLRVCKRRRLPVHACCILHLRPGGSVCVCV